MSANVARQRAAIVVELPTTEALLEQSSRERRRAANGAPPAGPLSTLWLDAVAS
jgi:hypothetical protein